MLLTACSFEKIYSLIHIPQARHETQSHNPIGWHAGLSYCGVGSWLPPTSMKLLILASFRIFLMRSLNAASDMLLILWTMSTRVSCRQAYLYWKTSAVVVNGSCDRRAPHSIEDGNCRCLAR